jgi:hypothetical protein
MNVTLPNSFFRDDFFSLTFRLLYLHRLFPKRVNLMSNTEIAELLNCDSASVRSTKAQLMTRGVINVKPTKRASMGREGRRKYDYVAKWPKTPPYSGDTADTVNTLVSSYKPEVDGQTYDIPTTFMADLTVCGTTRVLLGYRVFGDALNAIPTDDQMGVFGYINYGSFSGARYYLINQGSMEKVRHGTRTPNLSNYYSHWPEYPPYEGAALEAWNKLNDKTTR